MKYRQSNARFSKPLKFGVYCQPYFNAPCIHWKTNGLYQFTIFNLHVSQLSMGSPKSFSYCLKRILAIVILFFFLQRVYCHVERYNGHCFGFLPLNLLVCSVSTQLLGCNKHYTLILFPLILITHLTRSSISRVLSIVMKPCKVSINNIDLLLYFEFSKHKQERIKMSLAWILWRHCWLHISFAWSRTIESNDSLFVLGFPMTQGPLGLHCTQFDDSMVAHALDFLSFPLGIQWKP